MSTEYLKKKHTGTGRILLVYWSLQYFFPFFLFFKIIFLVLFLLFFCMVFYFLFPYSVFTVYWYTLHHFIGRVHYFSSHRLAIDCVVRPIAMDQSVAIFGNDIFTLLYYYQSIYQITNIRKPTIPMFDYVFYFFFITLVKFTMCAVTLCVHALIALCCIVFNSIDHMCLCNHLSDMNSVSLRQCVLQIPGAIDQIECHL